MYIMWIVIIIIVYVTHNTEEIHCVLQ